MFFEANLATTFWLPAATKPGGAAGPAGQRIINLMAASSSTALCFPWRLTALLTTSMDMLLPGLDEMPFYRLKLGWTDCAITKLLPPPLCLT